MSSKAAQQSTSSKADRTRKYILDIAQREASLNGIDGLTIGGLAQSCELSKSGLNAHFGSKEMLQLAVIDAIAQRFKAEVAEAVLNAPPGRTRLAAIMKHWIAWSDNPSRPGGCQLIAAVFDFDGINGHVRDSLSDWIALWRNTIRACVLEANAIEGLNLDPDNTASLAFGLYMSQHMERLLLNDDNAQMRVLETWLTAVGVQETSEL